MKILHLNNTYTPYGGIEQYILALLKLLKNHEHFILYRMQSPHSIINGSCPSQLISYSSNGNDFYAIRQLIAKEEVDVAFLHAVYEPKVIEIISHVIPTVAYLHGFAPVCAGLGKFFRRGNIVCNKPFGLSCLPTIYLRRCSEARNPLTTKALFNKTKELKKAYQQLKLIVVASTYMKDLLIENGFSADKIYELPPHFEMPQPWIQPQPDPPIILYSGRLEIEKGFPSLLQAVKRINSHFVLWVAGDGSYKVEYQRLVGKLGLEDRVTFLGWQSSEELRKIYQKSSLVVIPSVFPEPFGKVGIEAMANGRPVVAFDVGGISDWLLDGETGYLINPCDINQLAAAMEKIIQNKELIKLFGERGQQFVSENYSPSSHADTLNKIFHSVLS